MVEFDFDATRRWARLNPRKTLARRIDDVLPFVNARLTGGQGLLLDTCVYIDQMQDRTPHLLNQLIAQRQINILLQLGLQKSSELPDVPLIMDLATNDDQRLILNQ